MNQIKTPVLPDTSLCAIARDEKENPAGGIIDFVESTVPFVEAAVIVDTGSLDGTRELLEELESQYPNLTIFDKPFRDYASSRNHALSKVKTKRALVLDADERLTAEDFSRLIKIMEERPAMGYKFKYTCVGIKRTGIEKKATCSPRLFEVLEQMHYKNTEEGWAEQLYVGNDRADSLKHFMAPIDIRIKHFYPSELSYSKKLNDWYGVVVMEGRQLAPSQVASFSEWKEFNPKRNRYG